MRKSQTNTCFSSKDLKKNSLGSQDMLYSRREIRSDSVTTYRMNAAKMSHIITDMSLAQTAKNYTSVSGCFLECSTEMKKKRDAALLDLLDTHGEANQIFVTRSELEGMSLFKFSDFVFNIKQQSFTPSCGTKIILQYFSISVVFVIFGFLLCLIGFLLFFQSRDYLELEIPYTSNQKQISLPLNSIASWSATRPVYIYAHLHGFRSFYTSFTSRDTTSSLLNHSCKDTRTLECFRAVRSPQTVPEIEHLAQKPPKELVFPSGIFEFLFYNDYFSIYRLDTSENISIDTVTLVHHVEMLLHTSKFHPDCVLKSLSKCWVSPWSTRFQSWMASMWNLQDRLLLGKIPQGLSPVLHQIILSQNVWPSEEFNVKKSLQFVQMSAWGTSQKASGLVCLFVGSLMLISAFVILTLKNWKFIEFPKLLKYSVYGQGI